jgi:amidohydrolase family protein
MGPIIRFTVLLATAAEALFSSTVTRSEPLSPSPKPSRTVALIGVNIIPMSAPGIRIAQTVVVRNGTIESLGPVLSTPVPKDALRIDASGKYLIPGLTDSHVHLQDSASINCVFLDLFLANGVTTILNLRGTPAHLKLRTEINEGRILGPRIFTSGRWIGDPVGLTPTTTPEEIEQMVRAQKRAGYDFVKLHGDLSRDAYGRLVRVTRLENIPLIGHAPRNLGIEPMLQERQHAVAHVEEYLYAYFYHQRDTHQPIPDLDNKIRTLAQETARAGTWVIPTLVVFRGIAEQISDLNAVLARPEVVYLPRSVGEAFGWWPPNNTYVNRFDKGTIPWFQAQYHLLERTTKAFQDSGVPLLSGTDTPTSAVVPGCSLHDELKALVTAGLTPYQALQTATVHAATFLEYPRTAGTVEVGKRADLVLLEQNPLSDISHVSAIAGVMVNGMWIPKSRLRSLLQDARKQQDNQ